NSCAISMFCEEAHVPPRKSMSATPTAIFSRLRNGGNSVGFAWQTTPYDNRRHREGCPDGFAPGRGRSRNRILNWPEPVAENAAVQVFLRSARVDAVRANL